MIKKYIMVLGVVFLGCAGANKPPVEVPKPSPDLPLLALLAVFI